MITALIVDDEPHARRYLKELLKSESEVMVIGECKNGQETLNFIKNKVPNIVFLDVQMPGMTGIEVASKIKNTVAFVVFTTAYDQYALKAFEVNALDYLLKPFEEKRFQEVLQKAMLTISRTQQALFSDKFVQLYKDYNQSLSPHITSFEIKEKGIVKEFKISDVFCIEASSVYAMLHLKEGTVLYRTALNLLEEQLPTNFIRVHRTFIVNIDCIESFKYLNNSTYSFTLKNGLIVISSRSYKDAIARILSN
jgi:two-component system, LytTR family, response regulator